MRSVGWTLVIAFLGLVESGCRDPGLDDGTPSIDGYRIEGTILDGLDQPIPGIDIMVYYDTLYVSNSPVPTRPYTLTSTGEYVTIDVYNSEDNVVRNLYAGTPSGPTVYVPWDKRRGDGSLAGSGLYTIRYVSGGQIRHSYDIAIHGHVTAETDSSGNFIVDNVNLPIDYFPAPFYSNSDTFLGNYRILDWVWLEFVVANQLYSLPVQVKEDAITFVPTVRIN